MATYQVTTEEGTFEIETDDSSAPSTTDTTTTTEQPSQTPERTKLDLMTQGKIIPKELKSQGVSQETFNQKAGDIAEGLGAKGFNPKLAAMAGEAFALIPTAFDAATTIPTIIGAPKVAATAAKALGETSVGQALRGTGNKAVAALSEKAAELPLTQASKLAESQSLRTAAKKGIQAAEEKVGLGLTNIQGKKELLSDAFAAKVARLADLGPEKIAKMSNPETLQTLRKTVQIGFKQGGENAPLYAKANKAFTEALGMHHPEIQDALSKYSQIEQVIKDLPANATREKHMLKLALVKARNLAKNQAGIRKTIGTIATVGVGGAIAQRLLK